MGNQQVKPIDIEDLIPLPGYPNYWTNGEGEIISTNQRKPKYMKRRLHYGKSKNAYYRSKVGPINALAHRVIAAVHVSRPLERGEVVNHINGNTLDNRLENLEVVSQYENVQHAVANKLYCSGKEWYEARNITIDG